MYLEHHDEAVATGARIVHACGFDSIPHDLGALFTVQQLPRDRAVTLRGMVRAGGTFSGGTFHSAMTAFSRAPGRCAARWRRAARRSRGPRVAGRAPSPGKPHRDAQLGYWLLPLPTIDPFVVRAVGGGPAGVRPGLPLQPLRRRQDAAVRRGRRGRGRRRLVVGAQVPPLRNRS